MVCLRQLAILDVADPPLQTGNPTQISYVGHYAHVPNALLTTITEDFTIFLLWSLIELNVAMICACLPTLRPMASKIPHSLRSTEGVKSLLSFHRFRHLRSQKGSTASLHSSSRDDIK